MVIATFRRAVAADAQCIGAFQTRSWEQTYRGLVPDEYLDGVTWQMRARRWGDRIMSGVDVTLALVGDNLVGVASTVESSDRGNLPDLELRSMYVDREVHGSGIARDLLAAAIGERSAHLLVFAVNDRAKSFYAKSGFAPTGEVLVDEGTGLLEERWLRRGHEIPPANSDGGAAQHQPDARHQ